MALFRTIPKSRLELNPMGCPRNPNRPALEEHVGHSKGSTGLKNSSYSVLRQWSGVAIPFLRENISEDVQVCLWGSRFCIGWTKCPFTVYVCESVFRTQMKLPDAMRQDLVALAFLGYILKRMFSFFLSLQNESFLYIQSASEPAARRWLKDVPSGWTLT